MKSLSNTKKALERIEYLFDQAKQNFKDNKELSSRYVQMVRKIAMKYKVRLNKDQKMSFCKNCNSYLMKGTNSTVRIHNKMIVLRCNKCGFVRKFGLSKSFNTK
ncbi:TPA: ribonuclease P [Candidatus Woesearchaeota archaeon]|nr:hypothetical protein [uncultured archaeon]MBS3173753.1 ribonuclease P [Candidatus Woesearchaeota archaeon]AQS33738.1 hypothetical protein [uncultured archaeon]HIH32297.1 ribonuclease P [Candidatus Woesearchaeota archaeon]HIH54572.1 ribonuclease P [Candidatus Woesearchaeota archaeon]